MKTIVFSIFTLITIFTSLFYYIHKINSESHPDEIGKTPLLTLKTAGKFGWVRYKGPIVRVSLYDEFIVISGREIIKINYKNLGFQKTDYNLFDNALLLLEDSKMHPSEVYLVTPDSKEFFEILKEKGVQIQ